jgi:hypothetical protein
MAWIRVMEASHEGFFQGPALYPLLGLLLGCLVRRLYLHVCLFIENAKEEDSAGHHLGSGYLSRLPPIWNVLFLIFRSLMQAFSADSVQLASNYFVQLITSQNWERETRHCGSQGLYLYQVHRPPLQQSQF